MKRSHQPLRSELSRRRTPRSVVRLHAQSPDRAFTLVEMMIAVALVLLIMTMFAEIFQIATSSLAKQRGLSENDQRARLLNTVIRADLDSRSFREVIPFTSEQDTTKVDTSKRQGYWYYAENDPDNDTDDLLQFTTLVSPKNGGDTTPYFGLAAPLTLLNRRVSSEDLNNGTFTVLGDYTTVFPAPTNAQNFIGHIWVSGSFNSDTGKTNDGRYGLLSTQLVGGNTEFTVRGPAMFAMDPNTRGTISLTEFQPDFDDGIFGNLIGQSSAAEIAYFLRGGNLYRRVLLIRESDSADPHLENGLPVFELSGVVQPDRYTGPVSPFWGRPLHQSTGIVGTQNSTSFRYPANATSPSFWNDFDYSAFYNRGFFETNQLLLGKPQFHTVVGSLSNELSSQKIHPPIGPISLGIPQQRFGHDPYSGIPREFVPADGLSGEFIGRFTTSECSSPSFGYPGTMYVDQNSSASDNCPMSLLTELHLNDDKSVSEFTVTPSLRRGADILMTNVLSFDVKVWDSQRAEFVDLCDSKNTGSFKNSNVLNGLYSPPNQYRYDTWHPKAVTVRRGVPLQKNPPFIAPVRAVQVTINYRDISSDQIRQVTIVQSLIDP